MHLHTVHGFCFPCNRALSSRNSRNDNDVGKLAENLTGIDPVDLAKDQSSGGEFELSRLCLRGHAIFPVVADRSVIS